MAIESEDASKVAEALAKNLLGVSKNPANFAGLPDDFWGYYAKGHDKKGSFGVFVAYSQKKSDIDEFIQRYEEWAKSKTGNK